MAVTTYPGVYIEEFTPGAPIQGVGTSTAALLGPSASGPLNEPTLLTSWDAFRQTFGDKPLPGFYLWYAVRGFFENGGQVCYVTRVSNASYDQLVLNDQATTPQPTVVLRARKPGVSTPKITVTVNGAVHAVAKASAKLYRPTATISSATGNLVTVGSPAEAAQFRPGDRITWNGTTETQPVQVLRIEGAGIRVAQPLAGTYSSGTVRLVDLQVGDTVLRISGAPKIGPGMVLLLEQTTPSLKDTVVVKQVLPEQIAPGTTTYRVTLRGGLKAGFNLDAASSDTTVESQEFSLSVTSGGATQQYTELGMDPEHPSFFVRVINQDAAGLVNAAFAEPPNITAAPKNLPASVAGPGQDLTGGTDDNPAGLTAAHYSQALALLEPIRDINLVAIPDRSDAQVQTALIDHCERLYNRFAVLDARRAAPLFGPGSVATQRQGLTSPKGFGALYYPWLLVPPASGSDLVLVPPSGHICGIMARTDTTRGVHKAPAGEEAVVSGSLGVERTMSDVDQGQLNLQGINVIRVFEPGGRPLLWGARTTSNDTNWQYVNIRRLFIFLEQSLERGIRWAVFEPNNLALWQKLKRTIREFLDRVWRDGALFGATADKAFYVRIDEALNPFTEQALGRLRIEIGVRPSYPAEFIIVRIGIWPGGSETEEQ